MSCMHMARARNPGNWLDHALTLMQAAQHLWPTAEGLMPAGGDNGTWAVGLMLAGRALEVLTKGLLIANTPALVSSDGLTKAITTHKLGQLLRDAGFDLDDEETELVNGLEVFSRWAGCYPTATQWTPSDPAPVVDTSDFFRCPQLFAKVRQQLEETARP